MYKYNIMYAHKTPAITADWQSADWRGAEAVDLLSILPESGSHIPRTRVKMLYNEEGIAGIFSVDDNFVVCKSVKDMEYVWEDSCVEFFVKPAGKPGYFNFEFNCLGTLFACYIVDCRRSEDGFMDFVKLSLENCALVERISTLKEIPGVEIAKPVNWELQFFIPFKLMELYCGPVDYKADEWKCNFNKCADNSSHPHWITWAPVKEFNFHAPECFGGLIFNK